MPSRPSDFPRVIEFVFVWLCACAYLFVYYYASGYLCMSPLLRNIQSGRVSSPEKKNGELDPTQP